MIAVAMRSPSGLMRCGDCGEVQEVHVHEDHGHYPEDCPCGECGAFALTLHEDPAP
jgi:hypothetical protein